MSVYYIIVVCAVFCAAVAQLLLKSSSMTKHSSSIGEYLNWKVVIGYGLMGLALLANIFAMSKGVQVKSVSIIETLSYLFVPTLSFIVFKEKLSKRKIMAIGVIMIGILVFFQ